MSRSCVGLSFGHLQPPLNFVSPIGLQSGGGAPTLPRGEQHVAQLQIMVIDTFQLQCCLSHIVCGAWAVAVGLRFHATPRSTRWQTLPPSATSPEASSVSSSSRSLPASYHQRNQHRDRNHRYHPFHSHSSSSSCFGIYISISITIRTNTGVLAASRLHLFMSHTCQSSRYAAPALPSAWQCTKAARICAT